MASSGENPCLFGANSDGNWVRLDLPEELLEYITNTQVTQFRITAPGFTGGLAEFSGTDDPDFAPVLNIVYGTNPTDEICETVSDLTASEITEESVNISWDNTSSDEFEYAFDQSESNPEEGIVTSENTFEATDLEPGTTYYFHIRRNCGIENYSDWVTITIETDEACLAVTNLEAFDITAHTASVSWDGTSTDEFEYVLNQDSSNPIGDGTSISGNSLNLEDLEAETEYFFHVRRDCGDGNYSDWVTVVIKTGMDEEELCDIVADLEAMSVTTNGASISWDGSDSDTFEFVFNQEETAPDGEGESIIGDSYDANGLTPGTTYYFHIRRDCGDGNYSDWMTIEIQTEDDLQVTQEEATSLFLYPNPTQDKLTVDYSQLNVEEIILENMMGQLVAIIPLNSSGKTILDVSPFPSGIYNVRVQTLNGGVVYKKISVMR